LAFAVIVNSAIAQETNHFSKSNELISQGCTNFQQAIKFQQQALGLNGASEKERKEMENRLALYQKEKPFRETSQK
jgi:hypothetical protein